MGLRQGEQQRRMPVANDTPEFRVRDLPVLAYALGFTLWLYKAGIATRADVMAKGFFDAAADMLAKGDHIHISASDGGAILYVTETQPHVVVRGMA